MKYCILVGINRYPIEESEVGKIVQGMADNSVLVLKCGVFSGKAINGIVRDLHAERGLNYHYELSGGDGWKAEDMKINIPELLKNNNTPRLK
jgi:hypothetical protein